MGTLWTSAKALFTIMTTDSLHIDAVEALSIHISIFIFGWGQDPYVRTINASDDVWEAGLCIKPTFYGRPGIGRYWPPYKMLCLSNKRISYLPNCLRDGTLVKPYKNDNGMVVISFKLEANRKCIVQCNIQLNFGVMLDQFYKRKKIRAKISFIRCLKELNVRTLQCMCHQTAASIKSQRKPYLLLY